MTDERKLVDIARARVPLKQILNGKEIREAMEALEKFRQKYNEQEFFYGAKVYLTYSQGECMATVKRPETDKELAARLDSERREREAKAERRRQRELQAEARERRRQALEQEQAEQKRQEAIRALELAAEQFGLKLVDKLDT